MKNLLRGIVKSKIAKNFKVNEKITRLPMCEMHDSLLNQNAYGRK
jgi:hypothetical protein